MSGYSKFGMTNTELGDRVEAALAARPGWKALVGKGGSGYRQGAFDLEAPDGAWCELKACAFDAMEWKVKSKAREVMSKVRAAEDADRMPATLIAVVWDDLSAAVYRRDGLGCWRLPKAGVYSGDVRGWTKVAQLNKI